MNFIKRDIDVARSVAVTGLQAVASGSQNGQLTYDPVEIITVLTDAVIILSTSIIAGIGYHLYTFGTPGDILECIGSAAIVAALFISLMKSLEMYKTSGATGSAHPSARHQHPLDSCVFFACGRDLCVEDRQ